MGAANTTKVCPNCGMALAGNITKCLYCKTYFQTEEMVTDHTYEEEE
jgi:hypothetical protein